MGSPLFCDAFAGRNVLVTGHTGFKGSWLAEWLIALEANVTGYALEPPTVPSLFCELALAERVTHVIGDVRDRAHLSEVLAASRPEVIFHLAAQPIVRTSYAEPVETYETNVMGTVNLLEAVRNCPDVRAVVVVTSDKCYENHEIDHAYREGDALGGFDPYSSSKGCAELVTAAYRRSFFGCGSPVRVATARAGNVIGGGDWAPDRIVPDCIRALQAGEPVAVRNPDAVRPWQHVLEPLGGYLYLACRMMREGSAFDGAWNFGPHADDVVPVRRLVESILAAWGSGTWEQPEAILRQPHEARLLMLDISKAHDVLGWDPLYPVERAVELTAAWYGARNRGADVRAITAADIEEYVSEARKRGASWASCGSRQGEVGE